MSDALQARKTTIERLNEAVYRHGILWTDLSERVQKNEGISRQIADDLVSRFIIKESISLPVAVALIDLIVEKKGELE